MVMAYFLLVKEGKDYLVKKPSRSPPAIVMTYLDFEQVSKVTSGYPKCILTESQKRPRLFELIKNKFLQSFVVSAIFRSMLRL